MMGHLLCASFQPIVQPGYYSNHHDTPPRPYSLELSDYPVPDQYSAEPDHQLADAIRDQLESYNMIVGWNSKLFDVPFLNARLSYFGERPVHAQFHLDLMWYAGGGSNRIGSRKLVNVQKYYKLPEVKTELEWSTWIRAGKGDPEARRYVKKHCEADVAVTAEAYWKLLPAVANIHR